jgi:hypothetical protein
VNNAMTDTQPAGAFRAGHRTSPPPLIDAKQASVLLGGVSEAWIRAEVRAERIPFVRLGARYVRFEPHQLEAWWQARRRGPVRTAADQVYSARTQNHTGRKARCEPRCRAEVGGVAGVLGARCYRWRYQLGAETGAERRRLAAPFPTPRSCRKPCRSQTLHTGM